MLMLIRWLQPSWPIMWTCLVYFDDFWSLCQVTTIITTHYVDEAMVVVVVVFCLMWCFDKPQIVNYYHQVTTIITTHYVDEARGANRVGFMRGGKLLAEDSPQVKTMMMMMIMMVMIMMIMMKVCHIKLLSNMFKSSTKSFYKDFSSDKIRQGLRCCRKWGVFCQQNSDA